MSIPKFCLLALICFGSLPLFSQWSNNPSVNTQITGLAFDENDQQLISDGEGGNIVLFAWKDVYPNLKLYIQKITAAGTLDWGTAQNPVLVTEAAVAPSLCRFIADGSGGAFITWTQTVAASDYEDVFIQHIDAKGNIRFGPNGININNSPTANEGDVSICTDGTGGFIIGWNTDNFLDTFQMFVQRFDSAGTAKWAAEGIAVSSGQGFRKGAIVQDDAHGAIAVFYDSKNDPDGQKYDSIVKKGFANADMDIYTQRIDSIGKRLWTEDGVPLYVGQGTQLLGDMFANQYIVPDGKGGAIIIYKNLVENVLANPYLQRINSSGDILWLKSGVPLYDANGAKSTYTKILSDGKEGVIIRFVRENEPRLQRIDASGTKMWDGNLSYQLSNVSVDGHGNTLFVFSRSENGKQVARVQKLNIDGIPQWGGDGVLVCNPLYSGDFTISADKSGSSVVTWIDKRNLTISGKDLYAAKIHADGLLASTVVSAKNGNWQDPATWEGGKVPSDESEIIIRHTVTVNVNVNCRLLKLELDGNLKISAGISVSISH